MQELAFQRCTLHWQREAVARCPECTRFYCRECITEHEGRVVCAGCLKKLIRPVEAKRRHPFRFFMNTVKFISGIIILWLFFYYIGRILMAIPASFHDGTFWK
jgi:hypothetical protein